MTGQDVFARVLEAYEARARRPRRGGPRAEPGRVPRRGRRGDRAGEPDGDERWQGIVEFHAHQAGRGVRAHRPSRLADLVDVVRALGLAGEEVATAAELLRLRRLSRAPDRGASRVRHASPRASRGPTAAAPTSRRRSHRAWVPRAVRELPVSITERPGRARRPRRSVRVPWPSCCRRRGRPPPAEGCSPGRRARAAARHHARSASATATSTSKRRSAARRATARSTRSRSNGSRRPAARCCCCSTPARRWTRTARTSTACPTSSARVVGRRRARAAVVRGLPARTRRGARARATRSGPYTPPTTHTRLLAVTAFGAQGAIPAPAEVVAGWRRLAARCRRSERAAARSHATPARAPPERPGHGHRDCDMGPGNRRP